MPPKLKILLAVSSKFLTSIVQVNAFVPLPAENGATGYYIKLQYNVNNLKRSFDDRLIFAYSKLEQTLDVLD